MGDRAVRRPGPVGEPAALLLQVGEAEDRVDQVVVGRELEGVDAGPGEAFTQGGLAPLCGRLEALAKARVVGVDEQLLADQLTREAPTVRSPSLVPSNVSASYLSETGTEEGR